jgi:hypothetical protein
MALTGNSFVSPQTLKTGFAATTTANTTFSTAPTNTVLLITAGANGSRVTRIEAIPLETVTANALQIYLSQDAGVTKYLVRMRTGGSDTVSGTDGSAEVDFGYSDDNPLMLGPADRIYVASGITKNYHWHSEQGDY